VIAKSTARPGGLVESNLGFDCILFSQPGRAEAVCGADALYDSAAVFHQHKGCFSELANAKNPAADLYFPAGVIL